MNAEILAIGPFSRELVSHLPFDQKYYENTHEGTKIIISVFDSMPGSSTSRQLAACFNIDPWDFAHHRLDASKADLSKLADVVGESLKARFVELIQHGFEFYFVPNG
ncbi:MAG: hypothetical protein K8F91_05880 [Candidatus Obscuribacterales bacterium]|nr:hypothetical protein [Candidatus Obscuribacterales bacterium]